MKDVIQELKQKFTNLSDPIDIKNDNIINKDLYMTVKPIKMIFVDNHIPTNTYDPAFDKFLNENPPLEFEKKEKKQIRRKRSKVEFEEEEIEEYEIVKKLDLSHLFKDINYLWYDRPIIYALHLEVNDKHLIKIGHTDKIYDSINDKGHFHTLFRELSSHYEDVKFIKILCLIERKHKDDEKILLSKTLPFFYILCSKFKANELCCLSDNYVVYQKYRRYTDGCLGVIKYVEQNFYHEYNYETYISYMLI